MRKNSVKAHGYKACTALLLVTLALTPSTSAQSPATAGATDAEIEILAGQMSDPVYAKRVGATRRLCAIGQPAMEALRRFADGADEEAALRARKVIQALERVLFAGVDVRLESDRPSFEWNEPIDVRIVLENRSRFPARVPFDTGTDQSDGESADARQVAHMIDASDWLVVQTSRAREVELRVDEISDDPAVLRIVQDRLAGGPISHLAPGERATVTLIALNRGWARYPLLDEGEYTVALRYVPEWVDPVLAQENVGEVRSNTLSLRVSKGAPEAVSRGGAQAEMGIRREENELIGSITNHTDRAMLINTNYGVSAPFAEIQWIYEREGRREAIAAGPVPGRTWVDFDARKFVTLEPGASLDLARVHAVDLMGALGKAGADVVAGEGTFAFTYFNLCDRQWQMREQANLDKDESAPAVFRTALPRELLSTRLTSQTLRTWSVP